MTTLIAIVASLMLTSSANVQESRIVVKGTPENGRRLPDRLVWTTGVEASQAVVPPSGPRLAARGVIENGRRQADRLLWTDGSAAQDAAAATASDPCRTVARSVVEAGRRRPDRVSHVCDFMQGCTGDDHLRCCLMK